jgi:UDP-3-O-acyl-N-acetylglucosamine deacetylase
VEHVLAALAGLRIDNCWIELNGPEPPGLDGSAKAFAFALVEVGAQRQQARRAVWSVDRPVIVSAGNATLAIHPTATADLVMSYFLDYGIGAPIARQVHTQTITPASFPEDLAPCRTFLLEAEADEMRSMGIGLRTTAADLLVFGRRGPIDNQLRFANEPARHKVLDMVGDLSLLGIDLCGHVVACRSGHQLNIELVRRLRQIVNPAAAPTRLTA